MQMRLLFLSIVLLRSFDVIARYRAIKFTAFLDFIIA